MVNMVVAPLSWGAYIDRFFFQLSSIIKAAEESIFFRQRAVLHVILKKNFVKTIFQRMESVKIKQEIKEEPLDPDDFNPALIPKGKEK